MSRDDEAILDIYHAALDVLEFKDGLQKDAFLEDKKTQSAGMHPLLVPPRPVGHADFRRRPRTQSWRSSENYRRPLPRTTISLDTETRDRLKSLGRKGETYDELVNRLIDHYLRIEQAEGQAPPSGDEIDFERVG